MTPDERPASEKGTAIFDDDAATTPRPVAVARALGRVLSLLLLALVLAVAVIALVIPKVAGAIPLTVLSNSMAPSMPVGSLAMVRPTMDTLTGSAQTLDREQIDAVNEVDDIGIGDVIVFVPEASRDTLIIHRVIGVNVTSTGQRTFTTQGDNNSGVDDPVSSHQVRAVLWYHVPLLGYVNDAVDSGAKQWLAVGVAALGYSWALVLFARSFRRNRTVGDQE